jgi:UDP-glucose 4-epimerase
MDNFHELGHIAIRGKSGGNVQVQRVLVTGGAGFIGSHLVERLIETGAEVLVVDDFRLGQRAHLQDARASANGSLRVVEGDIRSNDDLRCIEEFSPDTVFHMAALHFIPYCAAHPAEALDINVLGLQSVIRALRSAPVESFVFASSGAVYGLGQDPWAETAPVRPDEIYGVSKWMGERILAQFHDDRPETRVVAARLFNTYGPRETNPHVVPDIVRAMNEGRPIELGNLWPKRDLIFVTDTADALVAVAAGEPGFEVFNVGTGVGTAIQDVVAAIEGLVGSTLEVRQVPERMRDGDGHLISDPRKLMKTTGWKPRYDLHTGLGRLLESERLR